jgi:hypothetical protein
MNNLIDKSKSREKKILDKSLHEDSDKANNSRMSLKDAEEIELKLRTEMNLLEKKLVELRNLLEKKNQELALVTPRIDAAKANILPGEEIERLIRIALRVAKDLSISSSEAAINVGLVADYRFPGFRGGGDKIEKHALGACATCADVIAKSMILQEFIKLINKIPGPLDPRIVPLIADINKLFVIIYTAAIASGKAAIISLQETDKKKAYDVLTFCEVLLSTRFKLL